MRPTEPPAAPDVGSPNDFVPAWWLPGPHLPTLWSSLARRRPAVASRDERLILEDGDFVDLRWVGGDSGPLVVVLHGLEGSQQNKFAFMGVETPAKARREEGE
jgi:uncharacterized protein